MIARMLSLVSGLLLASHAAAAAAPSGEALCRNNTALARQTWQAEAFVAPPQASALMVDAIDGNLQPLRIALAVMSPEDARSWRQLAMVTAAQAGRTAVVDALLNDGATVDEPASLPPYRPGLRQRLKQGTDARYGSGTSAALEARGIMRNVNHPLGPALLLAVQCNQADIVGLLLRRRANPTRRQTPDIADALELAVYQGEAPIVRQLLDHGATPCLDDRLARERAARLGRPVRTLQAAGRRAGLPQALLERLQCTSST